MEMPSTDDLPLAAVEYYKIVRGQIEHEDNLISQRLSWFVASQSFLFTAFAIVSSNLKGGEIAWVAHQHALQVLIPIASMLVCLLIYVTILAGMVAIGDLRRIYNVHFHANAPAGLPPVQGYRRTRVLGEAAPALLPPMFLFIWIFLLMRV